MPNIADAFANAVTKTTQAVELAAWRALGWPSEQAWRDAGSPSVSYAEWSAQQHAAAFEAEPLTPAPAVEAEPLAIGDTITADAAAASSVASPTQSPVITPSAAPLESQPITAGAQADILPPEQQIQPPPDRGLFGDIAGVVGDIYEALPGDRSRDPVPQVARDVGNLAVEALDVPRREVGVPLAAAAADVYYGLPGNREEPAFGDPYGVGQVDRETAIEVGSYITDPLNLVPGIGFTNFSDVVRLAKNAGLVDDAGRLLPGVTLQRVREALPELPLEAAQRLVSGTPVDVGDTTRLLVGPGAGRVAPEGATGRVVGGGAVDEFGNVVDETVSTQPVSSPAGAVPESVAEAAPAPEDLSAQLEASLRAFGREPPPATKTDDLTTRLEESLGIAETQGPEALRAAGTESVRGVTEAIGISSRAQGAVYREMEYVLRAIENLTGENMDAFRSLARGFVKERLATGIDPKQAVQELRSLRKNPEMLTEALSQHLLGDVSAYREAGSNALERTVKAVEAAGSDEAVVGLGRPRTEFPTTREVDVEQGGLGDIIRTAEQNQLAAASTRTPSNLGTAGPPPRPPRSEGQMNFGREWQPGKSKAQTAWETFISAWNLPRSVLASLDFSYPLRQGFLAMRHGKQWVDAFQTGFRAMFNDDLARQTMARLNAQQRGTLEITGDGGKLLEREEAFLSRWVEKIPGIRRSQQGATVFINKLRADIYDSVVRAWDRTGKTYGQADLDNLGRYINRLTGRGTLGKAEGMAQELATGLFSPRLLLSRVQAPGYLLNSSSLVRKEAFKDFFTVFGMTGSLMMAGQQAGLWDVELDPRSSDFMKMRIGKQRIDPWAGYQQMARLAARVLTGEVKSAYSGNVYDENIGQALWSFTRSKLAPSAGLLVDTITGQNFMGEDINLAPENVKREFYQRLMPIFWQDMIEAVKEGDPVGIIATVPQAFGTGGYNIPTRPIDQVVQDAASAGEVPTTYVDADGNERPVTTLWELRQADPEAADRIEEEHAAEIDKMRQSGTSERAQEIQDTFKSEQEVRDDTLLESNPAEWRSVSADEARKAGMILHGLYLEAYGPADQKREPKSLLEAAQIEYHALIEGATENGVVNWDQVDKGVSQMSEKKRDLLFQSRLAGETEPRKDYIKALEVLVPYWESSDPAWQELKTSIPGAENHDTWDSFRQSEVSKLVDTSGIGWSQAEAIIDRTYGFVDKLQSTYSDVFLAENYEEVLPLLNRYGYYVPKRWQAVLNGLMQLETAGASR